MNIINRIVQKTSRTEILAERCAFTRLGKALGNDSPPFICILYFLNLHENMKVRQQHSQLAATKQSLSNNIKHSISEKSTTIIQPISNNSINTNIQSTQTSQQLKHKKSATITNQQHIQSAKTSQPISNNMTS